MSDRLDLLTSVVGPVSRETFSALERFEAALLRWSKVTNLVAPSTTDDVWRRHIVDSAQLLLLSGNALRWVDLGSGGGLPAIVIAIFMKGRSGAVVHMVESNRKKAAFLQNCIGDMSLPAQVHAVRIDAAADLAQDAEIVTARALASLSDLFRLSEPWLTRGARGLFHKGREFEREIADCGAQWESKLVEHPSVAGGDGVILEVTSLARRHVS